MKKILLCIMILLCVGCGKEENRELDLSLARDNISKVEFSNKEFTFTDSQNFNNEDALEAYNIDKSLFIEYISYMSTTIVDPSMYLIIKVSDENKSLVEYQVQDMFEKYYNSYNNYYPEEAKMIEDRLEKELNGYLVYIVSYDNEKVYQAIEDSLK